VVLALVLVLALTVSQAQAPGAAVPPSSAAIEAAIAELASFNLPVRTKAAQLVRRLPIETAVPFLERAVAGHASEYVRYRAFVLLTSVDPDAAGRLARSSLDDRNDRLRAAAYRWFERHPDPSVLPALIAAVAREGSEFVRPAVSRALAAQGADPRVPPVLTPLVMKGEDFFRGSVIRALGDYRGVYARAEVSAVAELDGPLQDDAIAALGQFGDVSARTQLAALQKSAPAERQPMISAALCLIGVDCAARLAYLRQTMKFASADEAFRPLLEATVEALGTLAQAGKPEALAALFDAADGAPENAREVLSYGLAVVALGQPLTILTALEARQDVTQIAQLLLEGFDMVSEDFDEEQFFAEIRRAHWATEAGSSRRKIAELLIQRLEF
jgi:HEAT repeat protein